MRVNANTILIIILIVFGVYLVPAQNQKIQSPKMLAASALSRAQKWEDAATAFEDLLVEEPNNDEAWYQLGMARYSLKRYPEAANAFERSVAISGSGFAMYNLACVYSLMGKADKSIQWLTSAIENPKMVLATVNFNDPDLSPVKDDPRFKSLAEKVGRQLHPCLYSDEAKQFNFWIGEWEVYNPQGRHDGNSVIQSVSNGCGVLENWTDSFGGEGKSINFYDTNNQKWYQYWIGSAGGPGRWSGVYRDGAIRFETETVNSSGKKTLGRLTFFNIDANTVRQFAENSVDDGKTWTTAYDYKYIRKK